MTLSAFDSAKEILAHAHEAQPCTLTTKSDAAIPPEGMLVSCDIGNTAALPLLEAAIHRVHPEAKLLNATSIRGVIVCFPPQFKQLPIQQIAHHLRQLERDVADCISKQNDGTYVITRDAKIHPLDLHELLGDIASDYYRRENQKAKNLGKDQNSISPFDATPHFIMPKGEVMMDDNGIRRTKLDTRQAMDYIFQCKEQGKTTYNLGSLLGYATLGPVAANEVFNTLGLLPPGKSRFEIN